MSLKFAGKISDSLLDQARNWSEEPPPVTYAPTEWQLSQISAAAGLAASRIRCSPGTATYEEKKLIGQSAVGIAVAEDPDINFRDAVYAATVEIGREVGKTREGRGINSRSEDKPRFWAYWDGQTAQFRPPAAIESEMTLVAVFEALPERHKETLMQIAFTDSLDEGAELAGVVPVAFRQRVRTARTEALKVWFDGETPPTLKRLPINRRGRDRVCPQGHNIGGGNIETESRAGRVVERCKMCRSEQKDRYKEKAA